MVKEEEEEEEEEKEEGKRTDDVRYAVIALIRPDSPGVLIKWVCDERKWVNAA